MEIQKYYDEEKAANENKGKPGSKTVIGADGKIKAPEYLNQAKKPTKYK
jgi:hypothetical protein